MAIGLGRSPRTPRKALPPTRSAPATWTQTVSKEPAVAGEEFDKKQIELIQKVNAYFNQMGDLKGGFVQTSADNKRAARQVLRQAARAVSASTMPRPAGW